MERKSRMTIQRSALVAEFILPVSESMSSGYWWAGAGQLTYSVVHDTQYISHLVFLSYYYSTHITKGVQVYNVEKLESISCSFRNWPNVSR
jgi:hypothetical protein